MRAARFRQDLEEFHKRPTRSMVVAEKNSCPVAQAIPNRQNIVDGRVLEEGGERGETKDA